MPLVVLLSDAPALRASVLTALRAGGYDVAETTKTPTSLSALQQLAPHIVILDVDDGDDSSWRVLAELKAHPDPTTAATRVIMIGPPDDTTRLRALIDGALGYVPKPIEADDLRDQTSAALTDTAEPVLRQQAQRSALTQLAALERLAHTTTRSEPGTPRTARRGRARHTDEEPGAPRHRDDIPVQWDGVTDELSQGQRRVLFALGQTETFAEAARFLGISSSRISAQVRAVGKRLRIDHATVVDLARRGRLLRREESDRQRLSTELDTAIGTDQFVVDYQPVIALSDRQIAGAEALVRWQHPTRGLLPPRQFLSIAEATGAIWPLTRWILQQACTQATRWNIELRRDDLNVTVNITGRQATRADLVEVVRGALSDSKLDPSLLILDIPSETLTTAPTSARVSIEHLRTLGVRIAADDFGSPPLSLRRSKPLPIDILKIDASFVAGLGRTAFDTAIIASSLNLAASLNIATHAKGVETQHQLDLLTSLGCHNAQGFHIAPPTPPEKFATSGPRSARHY